VKANFDRRSRRLGDGRFLVPSEGHAKSGGHAKRVVTVIIALFAMVNVAAEERYSPYPSKTYPRNVYFGDTHLHTNLSVDAYGFGNERLSPDEAYRFAKGDEIRAHNGELVSLSRPLDFIVVADHAVNLGVFRRIAEREPKLMSTEIGQRWAAQLDKAEVLARDVLTQKTEQGFVDALNALYTGRLFYRGAWSEDFIEDTDIRRSAWEEVCDNADRHNVPGQFTAFIGYEWTPPTQHPKSPNLHRNVIFKGSGNEACRVLPFSYRNSENVEDLWSYLADYESSYGEVLAIPHNGNLSAGVMFGPDDFDGNPISAQYAKMRARFEPIYEVTQYKGDGETHPVLSPTDEFAAFETWNVPGYFGVIPDNFEEQKRYEYARSALQLGLQHEVNLGVNPFKFGMIGSTDAHTSLATANEDNYWGKLTIYEPSPYRAKRTWHFSAGGYAAVWAVENTREALFDALKRREAYATTGPRMTVRFFGGWSFNEADAHRADIAGIGYAKGVPMGGDLSNADAGQVPHFLVGAVKDPDGANLDRIQIVKGWRDEEGMLHEKVYNVALSGRREIASDGSVQPVGNTVDVAEASYKNTIGEAQLTAMWKDPDFDPGELAFYYARVIEIPTPRWTAYDAKRYGLSDLKVQDYGDVLGEASSKYLPREVPMIVQDRAYTSPIWYTP